MKFQHFLLLLFCGFLITCKNNQAVNQSETATSIDTAFAHLPPVEVPPEKPEIKKIIDEQTAKSPFKDLGCCVDETRRLKESCCCDLVVESYRKMKSDPKSGVDFGKLKMEDPILAICKKKKKIEKALELIDNPPPPPGKKPTTDDLF